MLMDGDVGTSLIIWDAWSEKDVIIDHWYIIGCLTLANFSTLPVNDRFVLPSIAHACSDHLIVVVT